MSLSHAHMTRAHVQFRAWTHLDISCTCCNKPFLSWGTDTSSPQASIGGSVRLLTVLNIADASYKHSSHSQSREVRFVTPHILTITDFEDVNYLPTIRYMPRRIHGHPHPLQIAAAYSCAGQQKLRVCLLSR